MSKRRGPLSPTTSDSYQAEVVRSASAPPGTVQNEGAGSAADGEVAIQLFKNRAYLEELQKDVAPVIRSLLYCEKQCKLLARADSIALALPRSLPSEMRNMLLAVVRLPHLREHMTPDELRALDAIMGQGIDFGCKSDEDVPGALLRVKEYALRFGEAATSMRHLELRILDALSELNSQTRGIVAIPGESAGAVGETATSTAIGTETSKWMAGTRLDQADTHLDATGEIIVDALGKHGINEPQLRKQGREIARLAKTKFNSHFRDTLSNLRQRGILTNPGRGYYLSEFGRRFHEQRKVRTKSGLV